MAESKENRTAAERASDLSEEVLKRIEARQLAAIEAVRKLVDRLDDAVPDLVDDPSARKKVVGAIGDYYEQLTTTTNAYLRSAVRGASEVVSNTGDPKDLYGFLRSFVGSGSNAPSKERTTKHVVSSPPTGDKGP